MVQHYDQRQKQYNQGQDHEQYNQILGHEQYNQGQGKMGNLLLPILAAVGAGAATFYTMTRQSGQGQSKSQQVYQFEQNFEQDFEQEDQNDQYQ